MLRRRLALMVLLCVVPLGIGAESPETNGLVILLTDYGTDSIYVGILKGAMYSRSTELKIDSITNDVPPFDVEAGAHLLLEGVQTYPPGTVFCCVVDPGVGTSRKPIVLATENGWYFVAPDNGLLTGVAARYGVAEIRQITNESLGHPGARSTTFHGRDTFGPVAAALAAGARLEDVGPKMEDMVKIDLPESRVEDGAARGRVIRVDVYGNLVTNIRAEALEQLGIGRGDGVDIVIGDDRYSAPYVKTYGEVPPGDRLVVIQSSGYVELAANMDRLAEILGEGLHAEVTLRKAESAR